MNYVGCFLCGSLYHLSRDCTDQQVPPLTHFSRNCHVPSLAGHNILLQQGISLRRAQGNAVQRVPEEPVEKVVVSSSPGVVMATPPAL